MNVNITTHQNHTYRVDAIEVGSNRTPVGVVDDDEVRARCREAVTMAGVFIARTRDGSATELMVPGRDVRQVTFIPTPPRPRW